jgi:hypothetical protein
MSSRPQSSGVTVLGIVMMAFGVMGLGAWPLTVAMRELGSQTRGGRNVQDMIWEGSLSWWMSFSLALATLFAILLLASGIGVFRRKAWAHKTSLAYGIATIVFAVISQLMNFVFLYPKLMEMLDSSNPVERASAAGGMMGGVVGGLFGLILPVVVTYAMTRPKVKAELGVADSSEPAS